MDPSGSGEATAEEARETAMILETYQTNVDEIEQTQQKVEEIVGLLNVLLLKMEVMDKVHGNL